MPKYNRATTVFSPEGKLLQVQYAQEAIKRSSTAVGVKGQGAIVLAVEKKALDTLQDDRSERKIVALDDHVALVYSGLKADARVLISRSQIECQSYRLTVEEPVTTEYVAKYIAGLKQSYTQTNGRRPFGISCIVAGYDLDKSSHLYCTGPSGICNEWKAIAIGKCDKSVLDYLEKNYSEQLVSSEKGVLLLAVRSLLEVDRKGQRKFEVAIIRPCQQLHLLDQDQVKELIAEADIVRKSEKVT